MDQTAPHIYERSDGSSLMDDPQMAYQAGKKSQNVVYIAYKSSMPSAEATALRAHK